MDDKELDELIEVMYKQHLREILLDYEAWKDQNPCYLGYEIDEVVDWYIKISRPEKPDSSK